MKAEVIIVAAGAGTRFGSKVPKALVPLKGLPLIAHSLKIFEQNRGIDGIIVVANSRYLGRFQALTKRFKRVRAVVAGGKTRAESVKCGLAALKADTDAVLVHDAARPLVDAVMVKRLIEALRSNKAVIAAVPVKPTIKEVDPRTQTVVKTLRRDKLWEVQTPQGFHKDILVKAHSRTFKGEATDDAVLVEAMGVKVKAVMGSYRNIKITTPEDLLVAKAL